MVLQPLRVINYGTLLHLQQICSKTPARAVEVCSIRPNTLFQELDDSKAQSSALAGASCRRRPAAPIWGLFAGACSRWAR